MARAGAADNKRSEEADADPSRKRSLGIYYTPRNAADILAYWAIRDRTDTILEPSFGGCSVLEAALDRLRGLGCVDPVRQLSGFDVDKTAFSHLVRLVPSPTNVSRFRQKDFLTTVASHSTLVTAAIGNPPFVSYHRMNENQRSVVEQWRKAHAPDFAMTASLWAYFLRHALSFIAPGGRLAFVLPASSVTADYAKPILDGAVRQFSRVIVCRLAQRLFREAGTDERTVLLLAEGFQQRDSAPRSLLECSATSVEGLRHVVQRLIGESAESIVDTTDVAARTAARETLDQMRQRGDLVALGECVNPVIGEVVGDTAFFVKSRNEWKALGVPERHLRAIVTRTRQLSGLQVTAADVRRKDAIPRLLLPPLNRVPKAIYRYVRRYSSDVRKANKTFAKRDPWYRTSYHANAGAFVASLSHDSPRIVLNSAGISCANGLYRLTRVSGVPWRELVAAASLTTTFALSSELHARILGSGGLKLEPSDIRALLIPRTVQSMDATKSKDLIRRLDRLLRDGNSEEAIRLADQSLLIDPAILTPERLSELRGLLVSLRAQRLIKT